MKEEALRAGIREQKEILRSLKADRKKGHKVDYLIDQTEGEIIALKRQIPRGHLLSFLPFLLLNASLAAFLFSGHFVPFVRKVVEDGPVKKWLVALIEVENHHFYSAGALAVLVAVAFVFQWKQRKVYAKIGNVVAVFLEITALVLVTSPWNQIRG